MDTPEIACDACGWSGAFAEVWVEDEDGNVGLDPDRKHTDPPYYCPHCGSDLE